MDFIRSCYKSKMRLFNDRVDVLVDGQWYWCPPGASLVPMPHAFGSSQWDWSTVRQTPELGEVKPKGAWVTGAGPAGLTGEHYCGSPAVWRNGVPYAERGLMPVDAAGVPLCCDRLFVFEAGLEVSADMTPGPIVFAALEVEASFRNLGSLFAGLDVQAIMGPQGSVMTEVEVYAQMGPQQAAIAELEVEAKFEAMLMLLAELEITATLSFDYSMRAEVEVSATASPAGAGPISTACCPAVPRTVVLEITGFSLYSWISGIFPLQFAAITNTWVCSWSDGGVALRWELKCSGFLEDPMDNWLLILWADDCAAMPRAIGAGPTNPIAPNTCAPFSVYIDFEMLYDHCSTTPVAAFFNGHIHG